MAVTKKIEIDGKEVTFKASAAVPRLYRIKFGRDIYKDLRQLEKSVGKNDEDNSKALAGLRLFGSHPAPFVRTCSGRCIS